MIVEPKLEKGISIIICCYNSALRLPKTIQHIAKQEVNSKIQWEVLIINNASKDDTEVVAAREWKKYNSSIPFKIINEEKQGLSAARERGFEAARFSYMLLCDDDNWLESNYLNLAFDIMEANSEISVLGGKGEAAFENDPPLWFEKVQHSYAIGPQYKSSGDITMTKRYVFGAGCVIRKAAWKKLKDNNFTSLLSDRKGDSLSSGGDIELCYILVLVGYKIWYDERLAFKHFVPRQRLSWDYFIRLQKGFAKSRVLLGVYSHFFKKDVEIKNNQQKSIWLRDLYYLLKAVPQDIVSLLDYKVKGKEGDLDSATAIFNIYKIYNYFLLRGKLDKEIRRIQNFLLNFN